MRLRAERPTKSLSLSLSPVPFCIFTITPFSLSLHHYSVFFFLPSLHSFWPSHIIVFSSPLLLSFSVFTLFIFSLALPNNFLFLHNHSVLSLHQHILSLSILSAALLFLLCFSIFCHSLPLLSIFILSAIICCFYLHFHFLLCHIMPSWRFMALVFFVNICPSRVSFCHAYKSLTLMKSVITWRHNSVITWL